MSSDHWKFRIQDILSSIEAIFEYSQGLDFGGFVPDRKTVDAVIRNLIVIGEAAARIPEIVIQDHSEIPWADMRDMRNFVVHEYFRIKEQDDRTARFAQGAKAAKKSNLRSRVAVGAKGRLQQLTIPQMFRLEKTDVRCPISDVRKVLVFCSF